MVGHRRVEVVLSRAIPAPPQARRDLPLVPRPAASQLAQPTLKPGGPPAEQAAEEERQERPARGDIPVRRDGRRACKRTALQAALPENRVESLADLDGAILARSSEGPFRSRVRTWVDLTAAWALPAWPISLGWPQPEDHFVGHSGEKQRSSVRQGTPEVANPRRRQEWQELLSLDVDEGPRQLREPAVGREVNRRHP